MSDYTEVELQEFLDNELEGAAAKPSFKQKCSDFLGQAKAAFLLRCTPVVFGVSAIVIIAIAVAFLVLFGKQTKDNATLANWYLPSTIRPSHYRLVLEPFLHNFTFDGYAEILIQIEETTNTVAIHSDEIEFSSVVITHNSWKNSKKLKSSDYNETTQINFFNFGTTLGPGEYTLVINFTGILNDHMSGFYRSSWKDELGEVHWIASTQFEATDARAAFPCFDEPSFKANYSISLIVGAGQLALSNMPELRRQRLSNNRDLVVFQDTVPLSTYLVAFIVGDFEAVSGTSKGRPVKVWSTPGKVQQCSFALEVTIKAVEFYESYFGVQYPLPKLDLIAIPDFAAGAMENMGLVTFRQTALLFNETKDSEGNKERVATVVSHELAHQWFGDLVTMKWWNNLWLNEAFAEFFETYSLSAIYPTWVMWESFVISEQNSAFDVDALSSTHAIVVDVETPDDIGEVFDDVTYSKGASVLWMMQNYFGKKFQKGLQRYQKTFKYNNTVAEDLFWSISQEINGDATFMMESWIKKPGYPVVVIEKGSGNNYVARQKRFYTYPQANNNNNTNTNDDTVWWIPLTLLLSDRSNQSVELSVTQPRVEFQLGSAKWFKANVKQTGFYRVDYPKDMWKQLSSAFYNSLLSSNDRAGLLNDAFELANSGSSQISVIDALELVSQLKREPGKVNDMEYSPWIMALTKLGDYDILLEDEACYGAFLDFVGDLVRKAVDKLGWGNPPSPPDQTLSHGVSLLRSSIVTAAVKYKVASAVALAQQQFRAYVRTRKAVEAELKQAIYSGAVANGGDEEFFQVLDLFRKEKDASEERRLLNALTVTPHRHLLLYVLRLSLNSSEVRAQDRSTVISRVALNPAGRELAWNFLRENWKDYNLRGIGVARIVDYVTSNFDSELMYNEVKSFFEANPPSGGARAVQQSLEKIQFNKAWLSRNAAPVCNWLFNHRGL